MIIDKKKIALFTDVMPSEQGTQNLTDHLMYTSVLFSGEQKYFSNLKEYKYLRKKGRQKTIDRLCNLIDDDKIWIRPTCVICRADIAEENGKRLIAEILDTKIGNLDEAKAINLKSFHINIKRAKMYANYAIILSMLSVTLSSIIKQFGANWGYIILDFLPGDQKDKSKQPGMEILKWITDGSKFLTTVWKESAEHCKCGNIGFAYAEFDPNYGFVIADWVAQSLHASVNVNTFRENIRDKQEERRQETSDLIFSIFKQYQRQGVEPEKIMKEMPLISSFEWNE